MGDGIDSKSLNSHQIPVSKFYSRRGFTLLRYNAMDMWPLLNLMSPRCAALRLVATLRLLLFCNNMGLKHY